VIGAGATIINSVLWDGAEISEDTYLENCVVGNGVTVQSSHASSTADRRAAAPPR
jgi:NDP-sugar pyrophosphorylase family protein